VIRVKEKRRAQVTLELAISFIGVFLLLLGAIKVFVWVNQRLVQRQVDYEDSRLISNADPNLIKEVDESGNAKKADGTLKYPRLNIFNE